MIGEYSRLHNSLKEGLQVLGHEVTLVSDGDAFKKYPSDHYIIPKLVSKGLPNIFRQIIFRLFKHDIAGWERGIRFYRLLPKLKNYDVVQFINEAPVKTIPSFEKYLLGRVMRQNNKSFLLCCGIDYIVMRYMLDRKPRYSLLDPYFKDKSLDGYLYMFDYIKKGHKKLHDFLYRNINGVIASDMDYYLPLKGNPKFIGLVANPVNLSRLTYTKVSIDGPIVIFLGINRAAYHKKGIPFFEQALQIIKQKYGSRIEIIVAESLPYDEYINLYNKAHIVLDQIYAYDQGYNAIEAMAKGKVVFTGAEKEFMDYYNLTKRVAVNALPDAQQLADELSYLIENPQEIEAIGKRAHDFIEREHEYVKVAGKYIEKWNKL